MWGIILRGRGTRLSTPPLHTPTNRRLDQPSECVESERDVDQFLPLLLAEEQLQGQEDEPLQIPDVDRRRVVVWSVELRPSTALLVADVAKPQSSTRSSSHHLHSRHQSMASQAAWWNYNLWGWVVTS